MNELILSPEQNKIAEQKREAWGQMGVVVYNAELKLQAEAQAALMNIQLPTTIEQVPLAENKLKEIKAAQKTIEGKRKEITSRFDDVTKRLMEPEKSFSDTIKNLSDAIVFVKREYEAEQKKKQDVLDDQKNIRAYYQNERIRIESELKQKVNALVNRCYETALRDNVEPENIEAYLNAAKQSVKANHLSFSLTKKGSSYAENIPLSESLFNEVMKIDIDHYLNSFKSEVDFKFSDYNIAFNNKADAIKQSQEEEKKRQEQIEFEKQQNELAAKLESSATPALVNPVFTKSLKKSYEVEMPETVESVLMIMAAFSANIQLCLPKLKVNKWFAFTPAQAANVLGKIKSEDSSFAPANIKFKEVDKL